MGRFKIDTKQLKEIATSRYEILALVAAGVLVVLCVLVGFMKFVGATSPEKGIKDDEAKIANARKAGGNRIPRATDISKDGWVPLRPNVDFRPMDDQAYFESGAAGENRRLQPMILAMDSDPKFLQVDYIHSPIFAYDLDNQGKLRVVKGSLEPFFTVPAKRLVVVSATFPYKKQCEEFAKALHMETVYELFQKGLAPTLEGIIVDRCEVTKSGGKEVEGEWQKVYWSDKDGKPMTTDAIQNLLKSCLYDVDNAEKYADLFYGQTGTPLPRLVSAGPGGVPKFVEYPEIKIAGIDKYVEKRQPSTSVGPAVGPGKKSGEPGGADVPFTRGPISPKREQYVPTVSSTARESEVKELKDLTEAIKDQIAGNINWFDPNGDFPPSLDDDEGDDQPKESKDPKDPKQPKIGKGEGMPKGTGGGKIKGLKMPRNNEEQPAKGNVPGPGNPPGKGMPGDLGMNPKAPTTLPTFDKGLIRFVDVDVEPGKSYKYRIKLRIANPNYKQSTKVVLNSEFAKAKEFETPVWVVTKTVDVPQEYFFYAINQEKGFITRAAGKNAIDREVTTLATHDKVAFQIHKFIDDTAEDGTKRQVSGWVVCERLLVTRGEAVGRDKVGEKTSNTVDVELVIWNKTKNMFELGTVKGAGKTAPGFVNGVPVDFRAKQVMYLLDFVGGKQQLKSGSFEDSACEALLLMPDGSLMVRNSRNDMNDGWVGSTRPELVQQPHVQGVQRRESVEAWKKALEEIRESEQKDLKGKEKDPKKGPAGGN
jgi:hypothetical protein